MAVVVLFSGGSDSTLVAAKAIESAQKVFLFTGDRAGFYRPRESTEPSSARLKNVYGENTFERVIGSIESKHRWINTVARKRLYPTHGRYVSLLGFSKLSLYWAARDFALTNGCSQIWDGATAYMHRYPDQNRRVGIPLLAEWLNQKKITLAHPVYRGAATVEDQLFERGLIPFSHHRGTPRDQQVNYSEQIIFALASKFLIARHGYRNFTQRANHVYRDTLRLIDELS